jgi:hypothetical protein
LSSPWAYLRDAFARLPTLCGEQLDKLLPDVWLVAHPEHGWQIDGRRRAERRRKRR